MIPRTFPSTYASNGQQQMVVYFLPSIAGLQRWLDYIPVKLAQGGVENSYNNNGYIDVTVVSRPTAAQQAWKEYIPVYLDDAATDAWRVNATGYIPYGYALFGGASMIMDMTNTGALDPRVTFSRTSNATQFDSAGNLVYAPHNLLLFSEQFDNAAWVKTSATIAANTVVAPNGTTTADTITLAGAGGDQRATQGGVVPLGAACTFSVWLKGTAGQTVNIELDTTALTVTLTAAWVRYSVSGPSAATTAVCRVISRSGNNATVFDVWGAQLNVGTLQPYYPTTVKNALGFSQEFDNAAWTKAAATVTANATAAPDGSVTADKLVENAANAYHYILQASTTTANTPLTYSVYAKAAERNFINIQLGSSFTNQGVSVNLTTGQKLEYNSPTATSVTSVGNGWWRISISAATSGTAPAVLILPCSTLSNNPIYTGDGTSGIFIWGAQLSDSASLDPYVYNPVAAPTAAAYYGPRFDYDPATLAARGLLIEEQRTNLLLNSDTLATQNVTVAAVAHTLSFYGTGTVTLSGVSTAGPLVGTGVFPSRVTLTFTPTAGTLTLTVTGSVRFAQLEAGAFATSYIPTTTAAATRTADVATMVGANFSNWYNQIEGTLFAQFSAPNTETTTRIVVGASDGTTSEWTLIGKGISNRSTSEVYDGVAQVSISSAVGNLVNTAGKVAFAYKLNDFAASTNGQLDGTDVSGTLPTVTQLNIGDRPTGARQINGWVNRIAYFPTRLTNAQLQAVTA